MRAVCVGYKAHLGWVNAVAVAVRGARPEPLDCRRLDLTSGAPREISEPYHVAGGWHGLERVAPAADPAAVVARGRAAQARAAARVLRGYRDYLAGEGLEWRRAVVLCGRGRAGSDLARLLRSHAQIHVAEGEAVRDALRAALRSLDIPCANQDEKSIGPGAAAALGVADPEALLRAARPAGARSWRREERTIALGAWLNRGR